MNISQITKGIDPFLDRIYSPLHKFVPQWEKYLDGLEKNSICRSVYIKIGERIPRKCIFKAYFDLNFTPCKFNPLFPYLMELAIWSANINAAAKVALMLEKYGVTTLDDFYLEEE